MAQDKPQNEIDKDDTPFPLWVIAIIPVFMLVIMPFFFFPIAQDWAWIEAWLFIATFALNMTISNYLINKKNPRVLRNRAKMKKVGITEKTKISAGSDIYIMPFFAIGFIGAMILPAFDYRNDWSQIPFAVEIIGLVVFNIGVVIMNIAQLQNPYASKLLDINKDQKLIDTGLYAHIRHPLYSGALLMVLGIPIALGSWISLIPAAIVVLSMLIRIKFEEKMLINGMDGYEDYRTRVKYKLIPKIY
jgi:protein-S-isoprenylcysteine O-methyltransferase Ste14